VLHPAIKVTEKSEIEGKGLVADRLIAQGEVIWQLEPDEVRYHPSEILTWPKEKQSQFNRYGFQCGEEEFVFVGGIDRYMNHSCDPNTWWEDELILAARRDIQPGEEVTYDYATLDILLEYQMSCSCGNVCCRRVITNKDYLKPAWQKQYGRHLPGYVLKAIACGKFE
jgi:hypothetical protein